MLSPNDYHHHQLNCGGSYWLHFTGNVTGGENRNFLHQLYLWPRKKADVKHLFGMESAQLPVLTRAEKVL